MDMDAFRDDDEEGPSDDYRSDAYWRRRALTLALGLVLLAVLIWVFTGGGGGQPGSPAATSTRQPSLQPEAAYSAVPTAPPATQGSLKTPTARRTAGTRPSSTADAAAQSGGKSGKGGKGSKGGNGGGSGSGTGGQCSPGDIVLSLLSNKSSYSAGEDPRFEVYVVSTGQAACTFELGPAKLQVQVMSAGRIVWDSADCARGDSTRVGMLRRGVPSQESVTWNRTSTLPGCVRLASSVRPGTYQVRVKAGTTTSAVLAIKLDR
jgi:hypothetical protein